MAEATYIRVPLKDENGATKALLYSEGAKPKTAGEFTKASEMYSTTGKVPTGFAVVDPAQFLTGPASALFQEANIPVQKGLRSVGRFTGGMGISLAGLAAEGGERIGLTRPGLGQELINMLPQAQKAGEKAGEFVGELVSTPEKLGATLGYGGVQALTKNMSGVLPMLARSVSPAVGAFLMDEITGQGQQKQQKNRMNDFVTTTLISAGGESVYTILGRVFGQYISQTAKEEVASGIMEVVKESAKKLGIPITSGAALNAIPSTKKGLEDVTRIGIKALRGEADDVAQQLSDQIVTVLPAALKKRPKSEFTEFLQDFSKASEEYINAIGDKKATDVATKAMADAKSKAAGLLKKEFPNMSPEGQQKVVEAFVDYQRHLRDFTEARDIIHGLKITGENGFNPQGFQRYMANRAGVPGGMFEEVGEAAGRGVRGGVDTGVTANVNPLSKLPFVGKYVPPVNVPLSKTYAGRVPVSPIGLATRAGTLVGIKKYLEAD